MENHDPSINEENKTSEDLKSEEENKKVVLPQEAINNGVKEYDTWEKARNAGFIKFDDWNQAIKGGFESFEEWNQARNEGFDNKDDWDDWVDIKNSGIADLELFYETKNIGFYQTSLRKAFLVNLKLAKKGGFESFNDWKEAQKWNINSYDDWNLVKEMNLESVEEYELVKEFQGKLDELFRELYVNQEIAINRILDIFAEDYKYNRSETQSGQLIYHDFTKELFENILERTIRQVALDSEIFKYSRLNNSIMKVATLGMAQPKEGPRIINITSSIRCPNCQNKFDKSSTFCSHCGEKILKCSICLLPLLNENTGTCPSCNNTFHLNHIEEVIKVTGKCPICKEKLKEIDLI